MVTRNALFWSCHQPDVELNSLVAIWFRFLGIALFYYYYFLNSSYVFKSFNNHICKGSGQNHWQISFRKIHFHLSCHRFYLLKAILALQKNGQKAQSSNTLLYLPPFSTLSPLLTSHISMVHLSIIVIDPMLIPFIIIIN